MNNKLSLAIACGVAAMCISTTGFSAAHSEAKKSFNIGGDVELDITGTDQNDSTFDLVGGRIKLNAVGMVMGDNGHFAKGVVQPIVSLDDGSVGSDDVFFQFGKTNSWDLQLGRFEAINLLPAGKDTLVVKTGSVSGYNAGTLRGRQNNAAALHVGSADKFLFELGLVYNTSGDAETSGFRPAMTYKAGSMTFHAGIESGTVDDGAGTSTDTDGFGLGVTVGLGGGSLGLAYASGDNEVNGVDAGGSSSIAVNFTKNSWGVGYMHDEVKDSDLSEDTLYAAYTMPLLNLKDASVTFAASTSTADGLAAGAEDSVNAARVRFNYTF